MIRLLVVDDSALMRKLLRTIFEAEGDFEVEIARDGVEALATIGVFKPDVVTLDVHMPKLDGLACLDRIMVEHPCPVVMVSALTEEGAEATLNALEMGAVDFIPKPDGAISLTIETVRPRLVEKVRIAAGVKLRSSRRLLERVRLGRGAVTAAGPEQPAVTQRDGEVDGLVVVGTSTGGPPALDALLGGLDAGFAMPIIVAQHMPASFTGPLARRLDGLCALPVVEVTSPMPLQPGHVYIGHGDADVIVSKRAGRLIAMPAPLSSDYRWHPSVDRLVASAMKHVAPGKLVGVLMTGMGSDGASTMAQLRAAGGHTIAEAEETAVVWGMPGELVRQGGASVTVPLDKIAAALSRAVA